MSKRFTIAAQLSTVHASAAELTPDKVARHLDAVMRTVPIDILAVGWTERPELFRLLTAPETRPTKEVYLWYPLLSDFPGFDATHLVLNNRSEKSAGWSGYAGTGIAESFKLACPNNPHAVETSLEHLERLMTTYQFDGVFLDKIRFPSPANGLAEVFSCFCPHCVDKASRTGLSLDDVGSMLTDWRGDTVAADPVAIPEGAPWLEHLVASRPLVQRFLRFRADSVSAVVAEATRRMRKLGRKVSLDVFTPALAPLVGQDFTALAPGAAWIKPMIYRFGDGPANLRSELPRLIRELGAFLGQSEATAMARASEYIDGLEGATLADLETVTPLSFIRAETLKAMSLFDGTPLYLGLESVSIPKRMEIGPRDVAEILEIGAEAGIQGVTLSWDLMHTPVENLRPLRDYVD